MSLSKLFLTILICISTNKRFFNKEIIFEKIIFIVRLEMKFIIPDIT